MKILLELIGWFQIIVGCFMASVLFGAAFCQIIPHAEQMTVLIIFSSIGLILGACWASYIWNKHGTIEWLSRIRRIS